MTGEYQQQSGNEGHDVRPATIAVVSGVVLVLALVVTMAAEAEADVWFQPQSLSTFEERYLTFPIIGRVLYTGRQNHNQFESLAQELEIHIDPLREQPKSLLSRPYAQSKSKVIYGKFERIYEFLSRVDVRMRSGELEISEVQREELRSIWDLSARALSADGSINADMLEAAEELVLRFRY